MWAGASSVTLLAVLALSLEYGMYVWLLGVSRPEAEPSEGNETSTMIGCREGGSDMLALPTRCALRVGLRMRF
jgi:hypothetical protein